MEKCENEFLVGKWGNEARNHVAQPIVGNYLQPVGLAQSAADLSRDSGSEALSPGIMTEHDRDLWNHKGNIRSGEGLKCSTRTLRTVSEGTN